MINQSYFFYSFVQKKKKHIESSAIFLIEFQTRSRKMKLNPKTSIHQPVNVS